MSILELAAAVTAFIAPYLPSLLKVGKFVGEKAAEQTIKMGTTKSLERAGELWNSIKAHLTEQTGLQDAARLVASEPGDNTYQKAFVKALVKLLENHPELSPKLIQAMGGGDSVQKVLADHNSWVEDVSQNLSGPGTQQVKATNDSVVIKVRQTRK